MKTTELVRFSRVGKVNERKVPSSNESNLMKKLGKNGATLSPKMELTLVRTFCILSEIESLVVVIGK